MTEDEHKTAWIEATYETLGWDSEEKTIVFTGEEGIHILETQELLCKLGRGDKYDGSCSICRSIRRKLGT